MEQAQKIIGIYQIKNIKNNKIYIGSSKDIYRRWREHLYKLQNNIHHSIKLQRSYNKTKDKNIFLFEIVEEVTEEQLNEREQYYIDLYDSFRNGYNCCEKVDTPSSALKVSKKKEYKRLLDDYYHKFLELYVGNQNQFIFSKFLLDKLNDKHYTYSTYKNIVNIMTWFINNYNVGYVGRFNINSNRQYYIIIGDTEENEFACYKWFKNKMYISEYDTKIHRKTLETNCMLDLEKHYILDVPIYR